MFYCGIYHQPAAIRFSARLADMDPIFDNLPSMHNNLPIFYRNALHYSEYSGNLENTNLASPTN